jgi:hypothetical protein
MTITETPGPRTDPSMNNIWQLGFGFWSSKALLSAVELGAIPPRLNANRQHGFASFPRK